MKIDPYYRSGNISPVILVSGKIRFMSIFMGFAGKGASNESGVVENGDFRFFHSLYLPNFHTQGYKCMDFH